MRPSKEFFSILLSVILTLVGPLEGCRNPEPLRAAPEQTPPAQQVPPTTYATPTADQLYELVAPIALFPDNLVAQVLAAATYPDQVASANAWVQQSTKVKDQQRMEEVNKQPWDDSVKGLTQFPDVLQQMATNLSWTSALGDAYFNVPESVMNAVQVMRQRAYQAGNLKTNQQQNVSVQNERPSSTPASASSGESQTVVVPAPQQTIVIQPAQPDVVYVPTYNPTVVYGAPMPVYPGYSAGAMVATSMISFGVGVAVGAAFSGGCCGWGWNSWGMGWHNSTVVYNRNTYISRSNTFVNRNNYYNRNFNNANVNRNNINRNNVNRNNVNSNSFRANGFNNNGSPRAGNFTTPTFNQKYDQPQFNNNRGNLGQTNRQPMGPANQNRPNTLNQTQRQSSLGFGQQSDRGTRSTAFSNYGQGGNARMNSSRGQQSLGGNRNGAPRAQSHAMGGGRRR